MERLRRTQNDGTIIEIGFTDVHDGDFSIHAPGVDAARRSAVPLPWTWLHQVHGTTVRHVTRPGDHAGEEGDASVTAESGAVLAAQGADCAPIVFWSPEGPIGIAHCGWRGLERGVVEAAVARLRSLGAKRVSACVGPLIHPAGYEFGAEDLDRLSARFGDAVVARTNERTPALNVPTMIRVILTRAEVLIDHDLRTDTATSGRHFSHRTRGDVGRHCGFVYRMGAESPSS